MWSGNSSCDGVCTASRWHPTPASLLTQNNSILVDSLLSLLPDPFDFSPYATCWFGTNHIPSTRDFSDALFRHAVTIDFNRQFAGDQRDVRLADKLISELPGILNLALTAIAAVITRGTFTSSATCEMTKAHWRNENDQASQFVEDCCTPTVGHWIESALVYRRYTEWTHDAGIQKPLNRKNLSTRLAASGC